ncbi:MAG: hypothetical protein WC263_03200 [Candidatus Micrarchaeia archaeon]|jgi:uncharacterized membrane protein YiaA
MAKKADVLNEVKMLSAISKLDRTMSKVQGGIEEQNVNNKNTNSILIYLTIAMLFFGLAQITISTLTIKPETLADNALLSFVGLVVALYIGAVLAMAAIKKQPEDIKISWIPDIANIFWILALIVIGLIVIGLCLIFLSKKAG